MLFPTALLEGALSTLSTPIRGSSKVIKKQKTNKNKKKTQKSTHKKNPTKYRNEERKKKKMNKTRVNKIKAERWQGCTHGNLAPLS